jgi:electron transport complex protein RnfD
MPAPFILDRSSVTQVMAGAGRPAARHCGLLSGCSGPASSSLGALPPSPRWLPKPHAEGARSVSGKPFLTDLSAIVTAWLLALSLPSLRRGG